jgi:hypothetical protein
MRLRMLILFALVYYGIGGKTAASATPVSSAVIATSAMDWEVHKYILATAL